MRRMHSRGEQFGGNTTCKHPVGPQLESQVTVRITGVETPDVLSIDRNSKSSSIRI